MAADESAGDTSFVATDMPSVSRNFAMAASTRNSPAVMADNPEYKVLFAVNSSFSAFSTSSKVRWPMLNCAR